ncbi:hypothetical protein [Caldisericum sp.]|uniref:hypothetical protein n=1 Tax=Caldisericum sp. TaxID=2499687 RepID=UPI003D0F66D8
MVANIEEKKEENKSEDIIVKIRLDKFGDCIFVSERNNCRACKDLHTYTVLGRYGQCPTSKTYQHIDYVIKTKRINMLSQVEHIKPDFTMQAFLFSGGELAIIWNDEGKVLSGIYYNGTLYRLPFEIERILFRRIVYKMTYGKWSNEDAIANATFKVKFVIEEEAKEKKKEG